MLICPPPLSTEIEKGPVFGEMFKGGLEKSRQLPALYEAVAKMGGADFLDAGSVGPTVYISRPNGIKSLEPPSPGR